MAKKLVKLFLDSGAYSAWSRGRELSLKDYIKFIKENKEFIWHYVSLDAIPGKFGKRDNSQGEIEISAELSHRNQQTMKDAGLTPIPVFHQGEPIRFLEQMLKEREPYIGLSANKFVRVKEQRHWLDMVFSMLTDKQGRPLVKTHGFALTSFPLIRSYPWYTVDSTTWCLSPGYGQIIIPAWHNKKFDYLETPTRFAVSGVAHKSVSSQKRQVEGMAQQEQVLHVGIVERWLKENAKLTLTDVRYGTGARRRAMLHYYINLCRALKGIKFAGHRVAIFGNDHYDTSKMKALAPFNLILTYATSLNREWSEMLTDVGANDRLLSYWELRTRGSDLVQQYVETGKTGDHIPQKARGDWSEAYKNRRSLTLADRLAEYKELEGTENAPS